MSEKKASSLCFLFKPSFLFPKKLVVFFIILSLSVNGFAPSAQEVSKYSFVMVAITVVKSAAVQVFKKYDASLSAIAGDFYYSMFGTFEGTPLKPSGDKPVNNENSSDDYCTINDLYIKQATINEKTFKDDPNFHYALKNSLHSRTIFQKSDPFGFTAFVVIVLFLLFIAVILRRKDIEGENIININILKKEFSV